MPIATKLDRIRIYNEKLPSTMSQGPLITCVVRSHESSICYISTTTSPMATKLGKVGNYYEKLQTIKSHNPLNTWSLEIS